jgi:ATP adenylyltransferase
MMTLTDVVVRGGEPPMTRQTCRFCGVECRESVLHLTSRYVVVPSIGSLIEGWILIVPRRHVIVLAELDNQERSEFSRIVQHVDKLVRSRYGPTVHFEHGPAEAGKAGGCGVDHAHLHVVPFRYSLRVEAAKHPLWMRLDWTEVVDVHSAVAAHAAGLDYLYLREVDGTAWLSTATAIPSQLFRRILADRLALTGWDWKSHPRPEVAVRTLTRLAQG